MVQIKLPDGSIKDFPEAVSPRNVALSISKRLADAAIAAMARGQVVDLDRPLENGDGPIDVRILTPKDRESLDVLRHSTAHVMARAIMRLYPGVKLAFGPTTANGFYYDVVVPGHNLSEDDFAAIEAEMGRILKEAEPFERFSLPVEQARQFVADLGQTFKVEHIDEELHKYGVLSFYRQGEFVDLCRGPHIPHAGKVGAYKLLRSPAPTGKAGPTAKSFSAFTAPRTLTKRSLTPSSPSLRKPRSATIADWAAN